MSKYRCPICRVVADIDMLKRTRKIEVNAMKVPVFPRPGHVCELAKGIDEIDLSKLEKV